MTATTKSDLQKRLINLLQIYNLHTKYNHSKRMVASAQNCNKITFTDTKRTNQTDHEELLSFPA